ncbi:archaeosortase/exosortase family protein [Luteibaculum oceani]|uniref:Exosortase/archaeosortase family protein n=1 Tax=Luteibaculum oceani TaxID=1294296 RepID=A0A5C6V9K6_9FLAO|nr:archaeosortase/exosortase family protein [Luteibaculum oceani]TXC81430.1 hypothetical protein FRX97_05335 [Luteibaculum oceani]
MLRVTKFIFSLILFFIGYQTLMYLSGNEIHIFFRELVAEQSVGLLKFLGFDALLGCVGGVTSGINLGRSGILVVAEGCDGVDLLALFAAFAIAFPGPWKHKFWYVPLGLLLVHAFNILRVAALTILADYNIEVMKWNHKYTFIILVYSFVFVLWFYWIKKFAVPHAKRKMA